MDSLSKKIIQLAYAGAELLKDDIKESANNDSQKYNLMWNLVLNEFLYFILHLVNRISFSKFDQAKIGKFQNKLLPIVLKMMIVSFFDHWSEKLKVGIEHDFVKNLNNAEIEYSKCKIIFNDVLTKYNPKVDKSEIGVINMLCLNLGDIIDEETEILPIDTQLIVVDYAKDIITKKELRDLIIKAGAKL